nr:putative coat protein [Ipomoea batatas]
MATPNPQQNLPASSIGTSFQMRSELPTMPNTMVDVLQSTKTDLATAENFKLTTELLEKDLKKEVGTSLWIFRQHFVEKIFEIQCPLPKVNITKAMVITHARFLIGKLANPSRSFVNLAPLDLRCEIAFQEFSNTQPLQRRCWDSKSFNIVFNTVGSSDRILNDVPTKDRVYSSGLSLRGTLEGAEPIEEACSNVCYWYAQRFIKT